MHLNLTRAVLLALAVQLGFESAAWTRPEVAAAVPRVAVVFVRAAFVAGVAVVAVREGRRWSAPLAAVCAGVGPALAVALIGIASGQFLARGLGPVAVFAYLLGALYLSVSAALLGTAAALGYTRWQRRAA